MSVLSRALGLGKKNDSPTSSVCSPNNQPKGENEEFKLKSKITQKHILPKSSNAPNTLPLSPTTPRCLQAEKSLSRTPLLVRNRSSSVDADTLLRLGLGKKVQFDVPTSSSVHQSDKLAKKGLITSIHHIYISHLIFIDEKLILENNNFAIVRALLEYVCFLFNLFPSNSKLGHTRQIFYKSLNLSLHPCRPFSCVLCCPARGEKSRERSLQEMIFCFLYYLFFGQK
jgi:hypothetical protein